MAKSCPDMSFGVDSSPLWRVTLWPFSVRTWETFLQTISVLPLVEPKMMIIEAMD